MSHFHHPCVTIPGILWDLGCSSPIFVTLVWQFRVSRDPVGFGMSHVCDPSVTIQGLQGFRISQCLSPMCDSSRNSIWDVPVFISRVTIQEILWDLGCFNVCHPCVTVQGSCGVWDAPVLAVTPVPFLSERKAEQSPLWAGSLQHLQQLQGGFGFLWNSLQDPSPGLPSAPALF